MIDQAHHGHLPEHSSLGVLLISALDIFATGLGIGFMPRVNIRIYVKHTIRVHMFFSTVIVHVEMMHKQLKLFIKRASRVRPKALAHIKP